MMTVEGMKLKHAIAPANGSLSGSRISGFHKMSSCAFNLVSVFQLWSFGSFFCLERIEANRAESTSSSLADGRSTKSCLRTLWN